MCGGGDGGGAGAGAGAGGAEVCVGVINRLLSGESQHAFPAPAAPGKSFRFGLWFLCLFFWSCIVVSTGVSGRFPFDPTFLWLCCQLTTTVITGGGCLSLQGLKTTF